MFDINKFSAIQLGLASPEAIENWACKDTQNNPLEVTKPETINYRSQKPEPGGLFCERIFGPTHDYECYCGKCKKKAFAGTICDKCGVEVTTKSVRRERMSFIRLAAPVTHIWYLKGTPSRIALVLDVGPKEVEEVVYFVSHITLNAGTCPNIKYKDVLDETRAKERFIDALNTAMDDGLIAKDSADYEYANEFIEDMRSANFFDFETIAKFLAKYYPGLEFGIGAEAIQRLLSEVDLDSEYEKVSSELKATKNNAQQKKQKLAKRLEVLSAFKSSQNHPEWMVLTNLPVIPPDLRPMLPLDGSRFASADLNELYRRVIQRNDMVKNMYAKGGTGVMLINSKRMLQEAVDALIDNGRRSKSVQSQNGRPYKSLSAALKGKQGRFRQNLLGKRVDYSGRSVIAVGPDLRMDQCGLPREMAVQLFRPFIARKLVEQEICTTTKIAEIEHIDKNTPQMWSALEEVVKEHPVLLNRAPTLHRLGIQAYHPKLVEGRAIRLFPLSCTAFNADFDGDQMAVHVPLSNEARWEAENLMLSSKNILGPKDGKPIVTPTKDMVLGNYYLTVEEDSSDFLKKAEECKLTNDFAGAEKFELFAKSEGKVFASENEVLTAYETEQIHLHNRIAIRGSGLGNSTLTLDQNANYLVTTPGKIIFNQIFDKNFPFLNSTEDENFTRCPDKFFIVRGENIKEKITSMPKVKGFNGKFLSKIIDEFLKVHTVDKTSEMLNKMKDQGFKFSTKTAVTVSLFDIVDVDKKEVFEHTEEKIAQFEEAYEEGILTDEERHKFVTKTWTDVTKEMANQVMDKIKENNRNPLYMMIESGAVGKKESFNQLAGMKGIMKKPNGEDTELPIKSNFKDGLSVTEFFNSTHGTRKGGADTALKTAQSGYLTRKLVDVGHDVIVKECDCGCESGIVVKAIKDTSDGSTIEAFKPRIVGRYTMKNVLDDNGQVIVKADKLITEADADKIIAAGIDHIEIRSLFTCQTKNGVCQKCYGTNLANGQLVELGEAVGIIAAQSIGEPGTQLTMRNFNTGGVAGGGDITQGLPRVTELFEARRPKGESILSEIDGEITDIQLNEGRFTITVENDVDKKVYESMFGVKLARSLDEHGEVILDKKSLEKGDKVKAGQKLTEGAIYPQELLRITNDTKAAENYILSEVYKVYTKAAGVDINDKHIEIIVRQMFRKLLVTDGGLTNLLPGSKVTKDQLTAANKAITLDQIQEAADKKIEAQAVAHQIVQPITRASLDVDSWLSSASFQETTRVLSDATTRGKIDHLHGLKENVIVGKLIPCGTGLKPARFATEEESEKEAE